ncbi:MAG: DEAD/DEAH box helicase, partial [Planctomycetota bacterium]
MISSEDILGDSGRIAARLKNYEFRPQQLQMADAVANAIAERRHLVVEAGTGVGKSFGYLVPAILSLATGENLEDQGKKRRIIVSTHTISLQEQLMAKDIPLLNSVIPLEFAAVIGKGRGNYISLRRLKLAIERSESLFERDDEHHQIGLLKNWAQDTNDGSKSDFNYRILSSVWDEVRSDTSNCLSRKCPTYEDCHYFKARKRLQHADIIVVNHALFFVDLALRKSGINVLPDYDMVILDEAHTIQDVASSHLGLSVTRGQIDFALNKLFNEKKTKGLFVLHDLSGEGPVLVHRCRQAADEVFSAISRWANDHAKSKFGSTLTLRVNQQEIVENPLSAHLMNLANYTKTNAEKIDDSNDRLSFTSAAERLEAFAAELENWRLQRMEDSVYWIESSTNRYGRENVKLMAAPIDIGPQLREHLFNKVDTCVMTSATIAVGTDSFDYFQNQVGITNPATCKLGSPFDYGNQARLIVISNMADPTRDRDTHERQSIEAIKKYVAQTDGHAFVLCTSYSFLNRAVRDLTAWCAQHSLAIYSQGGGVDRSQLLEQFKKNPR